MERKTVGCLRVKLSAELFEYFLNRKPGKVESEQVSGLSEESPADYKYVRVYTSTRKFVDFDFEGLEVSGKLFTVTLGDQL